MRIGLVGCGRWGENHARTLRDMGYLYGIAENRSILAARKWTEQVTESYRDFFDHVDGVVVAVPTRLHFEVAREFLGRGIPVLVEKPLCASYTQALQLCDMPGLLMVGHVLAYHPSIQEMRGIAPTSVNIVRAHRQENTLCDQGVIWDFLPHDLSVLHHITGLWPRRHLAEGGPTTANVVLDYGLFKARILYSWECEQKRRDMLMTTETGSVFFDGTMPADPLRVELEHFLRCIETGSEPLTGREEALKVTKIVESVNRRMHAFPQSERAAALAGGVYPGVGRQAVSGDKEELRI